MKKLYFIYSSLLFIFLSLDSFAQNAALNPGNIVASNTTIYDRAGSATNYANNTNEWITIVGNPGATINLSGTYGLEACCDRIYIRDGYGNAGTILQTLSAATGTINYTGAVGQTLTVHLTSDFSGRAAGFAFTVTYSAAPAAPTSINLSGTASSVACGNSTIIKDHAGDNAAYGNNRNDYVVFNGAVGSTAILNIQGVYTTESGWDFLRVYNGVGTGGTVAYGPLSGSGNFNFTGVAGNTYTLSFTSDGSTGAAGFSLYTNYTGSCLPPSTPPSCAGSRQLLRMGQLVLQTVLHYLGQLLQVLRVMMFILAARVRHQHLFHQIR